jgi:hypothetical protein
MEEGVGVLKGITGFKGKKGKRGKLRTRPLADRSVRLQPYQIKIGQSCGRLFRKMQKICHSVVFYYYL